MRWLWYIWQLPQNLCGLIYRYCIGKKNLQKVENDDSRSVDAEVYLKQSPGGVTLGRYIFIWQSFSDQYMTIKHECGHVKQSRILGPLYLIIIGIPSILHAWLNDYIGCCRRHGSYYHFYTEKTADKLMGIIR